MFKEKIVQGCKGNWNFQARTKAGATTDLLITDTLTAKLWLGGSTPMLFAPTITFVDSTTVAMEIATAQSTTLNGGVVYPVEIYRDTGANLKCIGIGTITCIAAPK